MKSIFHVTCNTPEDLRQEFLNWLERHANNDQELAEHRAKTKREQLIFFTSARTYREIKRFWEEIIIDQTNEIQLRPSTQLLPTIQLGDES